MVFDRTAKVAGKIPETMAGEIGDAKGGSAALRMHANRRRRYGDTHINARVQQLDALLLRIAGYAEEVAALLGSLNAYAASSLWLDPEQTRSSAHNLDACADAVDQLAQRTDGLRAGFLALPRLPQDNGVAPEPVDTEALV